MVSVVRNPRGTAYFILNSFSTNSGIPVAGKTGTAQTGAEPHAWFAGYTFAERENMPDIAVAVVVEHQGEGSEYAAPIFRRVLELYFGIRPTRYWWETSVGVVASPTPEVTDTPTPEATETPNPEEPPTESPPNP
jgi:membrane peptidoglycan carboxypeptidase